MLKQYNFTDKNNEFFLKLFVFLPSVDIIPIPSLTVHRIFDEVIEGFCKLQKTSRPTLILGDMSFHTKNYV
jgi:hypothetical protein